MARLCGGRGDSGQAQQQDVGLDVRLVGLHREDAQDHHSVTAYLQAKAGLNCSSLQTRIEARAWILG